jgi:UDP-N-acetylmuramate--alanine ligase
MVTPEMSTKKQHIHFIGIGGYGMSAIARVLVEMGHKITGSDVAASELSNKLVAKGAEVYIGHVAEQVNGADLVVYSTACSQDNVEIVEARRQGIEVIHRAEMLAILLNEKKGIAVAGAHGKTTTSSMIALVLELCGTEPSFIIGGEIMNLGTNAKAGKGDFVVAEADESDGSFLNYFPAMGVVTNIEPDHLENYDGSFERLKEAYVTFLGQIQPSGKAVVCLDDEHLRGMLPAVKSDVITYGIDALDADYRAENIMLGDRCVSFDVIHHEAKLGTLHLNVPGLHNVANGLATLIVALEAGCSFEAVAAAIVQFSGAKRRFQVIGDVEGVLVVDDYAHHPTEIEATIAAARATGRRIVAVFQPQRYTRTFFLFDAFSLAFGGADEAILCDIYSPAGEKPIEGVSTASLVERIRANSNPNAMHIPTKDEVLEYLKEHTKSGDLVITMGAGDIYKVAYALSDYLKARV